jgi:TonB family protein
MTFAVVLGVVLAQATPSPAASPCQAEASVTKPVIPDVDLATREQVQPLYATVAVLVSADGKIEKTTIYKSSGSFAFDWASLRAAKLSTYKPKVVDCRPVEGTVLFKTSYTPDSPP